MAEKEYIERNALLASKNWLALQPLDKAYAISTIFDQPVADVIEVRHGHWIYFTGIHGYKQCKCSECLVSYGTIDTPYCPNCGAKMDEEDA